MVLNIGLKENIMVVLEEPKKLVPYVKNRILIP